MGLRAPVARGGCDQKACSEQPRRHDGLYDARDARVSVTGSVTVSFSVDLSPGPWHDAFRCFDPVPWRCFDAGEANCPHQHFWLGDADVDVNAGGDDFGAVGLLDVRVIRVTGV